VVEKWTLTEIEYRSVVDFLWASVKKAHFHAFFGGWEVLHQQKYLKFGRVDSLFGIIVAP